MGAETFEPRESSPKWFLDNLNHPGRSIVTRVAGKSIHMLAWNWERTELPTLMLVHGYGAHAHWWSFLAPFFADHYRVVAIDLPGMGDSDPPPEYNQSCFSRAIVGCIERNQLQPVTVVGHSYGGAQAIRAMGEAPHLFRHGIVVDSNVRLPPEPLIRKLQPKSAHKLSPSRAECAARFRLMPPRPDYIDALVYYIGYHSCTGDDRGWHWKADAACINSGEIEYPEILEAVSTKVDMIYGENSFLNVENKPVRVLSHFPNGGKLLIVPGAGHHIMAEYPLELVAAIKALLNDSSQPDPQ
ncbi:alpha/beta fold hydrolase [Ketobacter nezhaii]|uniref:alpha/beta fold hydrolase n=1 Tax=Ketobacter sp. MCCC 1A13808 TaxID=2602738 RepID=UPI0012EB5CC7|nr:alpha/beta hydrolase [Ketobacter sp. MCCC 1A13808]